MSEHGRRFIDLTGTTTQDNVYIIRYHGKGKRGASIWWCRCPYDGKEFAAYAANLKRPNHTTSCGCRQAEITRKRSTIHGESPRSGKSKEWWAVHNMLRRCEDPRCPVYCYYGGNGVWVCQGLHHVSHLINILGRRPENKTSIGRILNVGGYTCGACLDCKEHGWKLNVRWEDQKEQTNNTSTSLKFDGKSVAQIATEKGMSIHDVRLSLGLQNYDE